jgi:hypothetical protein
MKNEEN